MPEEGARVESVAKKPTGRAKRNQRQHKCHPLEPVQEHAVASHLDEPPRKQADGEGKQFKGKGILMRLRDGYVRLMNDMASSADMASVSAMYGCSSGQVDYPGTAVMAQLRKAKEEEDRVMALQETTANAPPSPTKM